MKVKVTSAIVREGKIVKPGTTVDVPNKEGAYLVSRGKAESLESEKAKGKAS